MTDGFNILGGIVVFVRRRGISPELCWHQEPFPGLLHGGHPESRNMIGVL